MATFVVIQMVLFSVAMAQQQFGGNNLDGLWFHITSAGNPFLPSSAPCLQRGQAVVKRDDYTYTPGIGGHKVHTRPLAWNEARKTCEEEGGHLAIINSIAEANAITDLLKPLNEIIGAGGNPKWFYIGIHDFYQPGEYVTIHGQSLAKAGYTQWADKQPDNVGRERCGSVHKTGGLNDINCEAKYGFVCEMPYY